MVILVSLILACTFWTAQPTPSVTVGDENVLAFDPRLPFYLGGTPEQQQEHIYSRHHAVANHTAEGDGLYRATTGSPASFNINLNATDEELTAGGWNVHPGRFIYVWIANHDQILIAEVVNNGDGTLTATYVSDFPGAYLVYVEDVVLDQHDEGMPITGSPFMLTISGDPTLDVSGLPACGAVVEDTKKEFWKPGTWLSSNIASATHGVSRDGWVFQPKTCTHDTFAFDDIMLLASLDKPTWLLIMGDSVQRGVFLTLVDMALAQGQKDDLHNSSVQKCWGYANVEVGNLRITYQDMRLFQLARREDSIICNNEKLVDGSTASYIHDSEEFLKSTVFQDGGPWPTVIFMQAFLVDQDQAQNIAIEVPMNVLPKTWHGTLLMVDHMAGLGAHWKQHNPTMAALNDVGIILHSKKPSADYGIGRMERYRQRDHRVVFISAFPMYQARLFENQNTKNGIRKYASSIHYHHVLPSTDPKTYSGARIVRSAITEMLSHITLEKAVGTKRELYEMATKTPNINTRTAAVRRSFELCTDCPANLLPTHVKVPPEPDCQTVSSLPGGAKMGDVWDQTMCPTWCLATEPTSQARTESGMVDVRTCNTDDAPA